MSQENTCLFLHARESRCGHVTRPILITRLKVLSGVLLHSYCFATQPSQEAACTGLQDAQPSCLQASSGSQPDTSVISLQVQARNLRITITVTHSYSSGMDSALPFLLSTY